MKLGMIRCMQTEDYYPGTTDFKAIQAKIGAFSEVPCVGEKDTDP